MLRGLSLLGFFFLTAGVVAVASLTKAPVPPSAPPRQPDRSRVRRSRYLALTAPVFHAQFSLN